jgi:hypothetical protein
MTVTIANATSNPILTTSGKSINAYSGVTVSDTASLTTSETVTITLAQSESNNPGDNFSFYPTAADLGTITDPNGGGAFNPSTETFTETGLVGGDPNFATALLNRLVYHAPTLPAGQGFGTQAQITVTDNAPIGISGPPRASTTFGDPVIVGVLSSPMVSPGVPDEPVASGKSLSPFATLAITSPSLSYYYYTETLTPGSQSSTYNSVLSYGYSAEDSATITVTDGGNPTDSDGLLTGPGLSKTGAGTYAIAPVYYYNLLSEIRALTFQTAAIPTGLNPSFQLVVTDSSTGLTTTQAPTTSVQIIAGPPPPPPPLPPPPSIIDPIWLQETSGPIALWQMSGNTIVNEGQVAVNPGPTWSAMDTGNFYGDGKNTVLWQNTDGSVALWHMDTFKGNTVDSGGILSPNPGPTWHVEGADNNLIMFQNDNGSVAFWAMSGTSVIGAGLIANPGPDWHVEGSANSFFGDGHVGIVFQNNDGAVALWDINGPNIVGGGFVTDADPGPTWHIKGTGDFYGDGHSDILWQNNDGSVAIWEMNGTKIIGGGVIPVNPGPTWHVKGTGDFNNDGHTDVSFQNDDGAVAIWDMNGTNVIGGGVIANPSSDWGIFDNSMKFIYSASANETLEATAAPDEFVFSSFASGSHTISGFNPTQDMIELSKAQFTSITEVQAATSTIAGGAMINLGNGNSLLLPGVDTRSLHASNFALG